MWCVTLHRIYSQFVFMLCCLPLDGYSTSSRYFLLRRAVLMDDFACWLLLVQHSIMRWHFVCCQFYAVTCHVSDGSKIEGNLIIFLFKKSVILDFACKNMCWKKISILHWVLLVESVEIWHKWLRQGRQARRCWIFRSKIDAADEGTKSSSIFRPKFSYSFEWQRKISL